MIDRTRSSIEEEFSLEEQNFQSVIDMETEDDYSRGNVALFTGVFSRTGSPIDTTLIAGPLNFYLQEILVTLSYMNLTGTATLPAIGNYHFQITDGTNIYFDNYANEYVNTLPGVFPNVVTVTVPINTPLRLGPESMTTRGVSLILHEVVLTSFTTIIFSLNIYGRILP